MSYVHIIHENPTWTAPLRAALERESVPYRDWYLDGGTVDLASAPPEGVFYNRMSASSHTRGHRYSPEQAGAVIAWLERHDRRVINTGRALALEVSKVAQYSALEAAGIRTPRTVAAIGAEGILTAARQFDAPFVIKPNRGGKGAGVEKFDDPEALGRFLESGGYEPPIDGVTLVQDYIAAPAPFITRVEFVGQRFLYAVRVDTSGGFELCPADVCGDDVCGVSAGPGEKFRIVEDFDHPIIDAYARFLADNRIHVAGIEFVADAAGTVYTYDINTNTNYNPDAEARAGRSGMAALARYLGEELALVDSGANTTRLAS